MQALIWFNANLTVQKFPTSEEIIKSDYDIIINVSDEHISECVVAANKSNKQYYWFPLNEIFSNDIGLNSIYAALQIMFIAEKENKKVLLHCHMGRNRSQTVADAFYFMKTGEHRITNEQFGIKNNVYKNRLLRNIGKGKLPETTEKFISLLPNSFNRKSGDKAGQIDYLNAEAQGVKLPFKIK